MPPSIRFLRRSLIATATVLLLSQCGEKDAPPRPTSGPTLEVRTDGLAYLPGQDEPYTGTTRTFAGEARHLTHEVHYLNGQKNGWESRWFGDNPTQLRKQLLWVRGEMAFHTEWWPNGHMKQMSSQTDGTKFGRENITFGTYVKWFEDGQIQFRAHYDSEFRWHGRVLDYNDEGTQMWDAVFDHGVYVSGFRPKEDPAPAVPLPTE